MRVEGKGRLTACEVLLLLQDFVQDSVQYFTQEVMEKVVSVNLEYRISGQVRELH